MHWEPLARGIVEVPYVVRLHVRKLVEVAGNVRAAGLPARRQGKLRKVPPSTYGGLDVGNLATVHVNVGNRVIHGRGGADGRADALGARDGRRGCPLSAVL